jgi:hypothetical protein
MAISEIDRVALYWPGRAIQKLRNERQGGHRRTSKNRPFAETEILEGGCKLYRVFHVANASNCRPRFLLDGTDAPLNCIII